MLWMMLACTLTEPQKESQEPVVEGSVPMTMVVTSALNGEYEPCG